MKNNMNVQVVCRRNEIGTLDFHLAAKGTEIYLFTTKYFSYTIFQEYRHGKRFEELFHNTKMFRQQKLKERILRMIKYTSQEYSLNLFEERKTKETKERGDIDYEYEVA